MSEANAETIKDRALRLLKAYREATEEAETPAFVSELAPQLGMEEAQAQAAFRYLVSKGYLDTFSIPYTGRINAHGIDHLIATEEQSTIPIESDFDAEEAVREAVKQLVREGKRAYSMSVPPAAERILFQQNEGFLTLAQAQQRIRDAIVTLAERGELEAYAEGYKDWSLVRRPAPEPATPIVSEHEWDVFISHASEDKDDFVRALAEQLRKLGLRVWYDEFTLRVGDSLRRSIDKGLAKSRFGVVVISPAFLAKEWPQKELDGLVAREIDGTKVILPVWHNITREEVAAHSPMLADRMAVSSSEGVDRVAARLQEAIEHAKRRT